MAQNFLVFVAALLLQVLAASGTLATCAAISHHLELTGCRTEARLAGLDASYCEHR